MGRLTRRMRRVWAQSRIRLPLRPLAPDDLAPGDRVEVEGVLWRVDALIHGEAGRAVGADLDVPEGEGRKARLFGPFPSGAAGEGCWLLIRGSESLAVPPEAILAFPVADDYPDRGR